MRSTSRILILATLLVVVLLSACQSTSRPAATPTPAPQWETFHSDEGGFSVLFPATPEKSLWSDQQSYGGIYTSTYQGMTYNAVFNIMAANQLPSDQILQSLRDNQATELKAKILSSTPIDFNGYPGLAYSLDAPKSKALPEGAVVQGRIYHVNDRVYIVYQTGPKKNSLLPDIKKYLGSLKVDGMVELPTAVSIAPNKVAAPKGWKEFTSEQDGFSVLLPGTPKREVIGNDETVETIRHFVDTGVHEYGVLSFHFKDPEMTKTRPMDFFDLVKKTLLEKPGVIISEKPIQLGPYLGYDLIIKQSTSEPQPVVGYYSVRVYLVGSHLYAVIAFTFGEDIPKEAVTFLDSFKVLDSK